MEFKPTNLNSSRCAFTLPEMMVAVALGVLLLLGAMSFYIFSLSSFASMANYADLNAKSRLASDLISRDLRAATSVANATTNQLVLNAVDGTNVTLNFDPVLRTLTRVKGAESRTLLKDISTLSFSLYQRPTNSAAFEQFPVGTPANAKLVAFQWSCSRRVSGPQNDSETIQAAIVELRNQ